MADKHHGAYSLNFFEGYYTKSLQGYDFELPATSHVDANSIDFEKDGEGVENIVENRWYFERK